MNPLDDLDRLVAGLSDEQLAEVADLLSPGALAQVTASVARQAGPPASPLAQAVEGDELYRVRPHLSELDRVLADAVADVEAGLDRRLIVSMPPRMGKSRLVSEELPLWVLRRNPSWSVVLAAHESGLATGFGRRIRRRVESGAVGLEVAPDAGAVSEWETTAGGSVTARGIRSSLTGRGARVLVIDDPIKDAAEAHSAAARDAVWDWWLNVALTRLEAPSLVVVVMTRWHEDDLVGRLLSPHTEGDPDDWTVVDLPAIADDELGNDGIGRANGEPLLSPLLDETAEAALERWNRTRRDVGSYVWSALYQQSPTPPAGRVFNLSWWRWWTSDPAIADRTVDVRFVDQSTLDAAPGVLAWDAAFKAADTSDYVVGQAWAQIGRDLFLVGQDRGRRTFTETLSAIRALSRRFPKLHPTIVEDKANGPAIIDTLQRELGAGAVVPVPADRSKVARATAVTPTVEDGRVYLPHPEQAPWVVELLDELRDFPGAAHDDQVDALVHALTWLDGRSTTATVSSPTGRTPRGSTRLARTIRG